MRRPLLSLVLVLLLSVLPFSSVLAFDAINIESSGVDMGFGYRSDQLDWSISGDMNGDNPNILSELSWEDIEIFQLQATGWLELGELPFLKRNSLVLVDISFGKILGGDVQDSDYSADDRNDEWSRSVNSADDGMTVDLSGAIGPIFDFEELKEFRFTPLIGYGFNMQALTMIDGRQVVASDTQAVGPLPGLDSSYTAYWYGPWLGMNIDCRVNEKLLVAMGVEYHWVEYFAQADWNLRYYFAHPVSFEHEATGTGIVWNIKGEYILNEKWSWLLSGNIQSWETGRGTDRTFYTNGSVSQTRLNQVSWDSYALTTGVQYRF